MEKINLKELIEKFRTGVITDEELQILKKCMEDGTSDEELDAYAQEKSGQDRHAFPLTKNQVDKAFVDTWSKLQLDPIIISRKSKTKWIMPISAVAAILLAIFHFLFQRSSDSESFKDLTNQTKDAILPGGPRAKIVLENGRSIDLESLKQDTTVLMNGYAIHKNSNGVLSYEITSDDIKPTTIYNTIMTPKGGEYKLNLTDGSTIWVNAASTLRYPLNLADDRRLVELQGEAYFEVKKLVKQGKNIPFLVQTGDQTLEVLGTSFNINSYANLIATTLVEGKIRLRFTDGKQQLLIPNQQAVYDNESKKISLQQIDPFYITSWKEGAFAFEDTPVFQVTETLARWYDVDFSYDTDIKDRKFTGTISKYEDIRKILKVIEQTGSIKFKIEGRRIRVM